MTISEFAQSKIGCGYVYGATGWICTPERRAQQAQQYPSQANNILNVSKKWDGKQCYDCAQLVRAAAKAEGINLPSGATSQWKAQVYAEIGKLPLGDGKWISDNLDAGTLLFRQDKNNASKMAHVGIYIGGGYVVEAKGAAYGVVKTKADGANWTHYGRLRGASTENNCSKQQNISAENATVNALIRADSGSTVNLRDEPSKNGKVLKKIPVGASVLCEDVTEWKKVTFGGATGFVMSEFVQKGNG